MKLVKNAGIWLVAVGVGLGSSACGSSTPQDSGCSPSAGSAGSCVAAGGFTGGTSASGGAGGNLSNGGAGASPEPYAEPADPVDATQVPSSVPTVNLTVAMSDVQALDAAPFSDVDVPGAFTDSTGTQYPTVAVHYRGAYALQTLIQSGASQRNWKVKFAKDQKYRGRREWNFTYEPDVRQKLAYDLMRLAGVRLPSARHVLLVVNGKNQGPYLEYEDPDDKAFLSDQFADDSGDLYKAAQDVPNQPRYFATFEVLGAADEDYFLHYNKKTNNDSSNATDFSLLRTFIQELNSQPSTEFATWLAAHFDVPKFLSYLVVANFISHWDGYPHRPKNFWLYQVPAAGRWVFIPWDMDGTFQSKKFTLNAMGTTASIFYQFDQTEPYGGHPEEGTERPLVRLAMKDAGLRAAYVARYRALLSSFLAKEFVRARLDALASLLAPLVVGREMTTFTSATEDMRAFVPAKYEAVTAELGAQP